MPNITVYVMTTWRNLPSKDSAIDATNLNHIEQGIKNATDFINTLNTTSGLFLCQTPFTTALKNKLDGIADNANNYVLPAATTNALGGVKVDAETITIDQDGVIHAAAAATQLSALTDVNLTSLEEGQILKWDATTSKWINTSEAEVRTQLSLLEDVDIDNPEDGDVLKYNASTEKWENGYSGDVLNYDDTLDVLGLPPNPIYRFRIATPVMTSNTTPSGEASASTHHQGDAYDAWRAFTQGSDAQGWVSTNGYVTNQWLQYEFDESKIITKIEITFRNVTNYSIFKAFDFQASNDGVNWDTLGSFGDIPNLGGKSYEYLINNDTSYLYYRVFITDNGNYDSYVGLRCLNMYEKYLA